MARASLVVGVAWRARAMRTSPGCRGIGNPVLMGEPRRHGQPPIPQVRLAIVELSDHGQTVIQDC